MTQLIESILEANESLKDIGLPHVINIVGALIIIFIGRWLALRSRRWFKLALNRTAVPVNKKVTNLAEATIYYGILLIVLTLSLVVLGIPFYSLISILSIFVIVIAIALQPSLSNLAATIVFLVFQTFKPGDWVDVLDGTFGQVKEIQLFGTVIVTQEKSTVTVPNGTVLKGNIVNYSELGYRRVDITVTITYQADLLQAKHIMEQVLAESEYVLNEPKAVVGVEELGDKGVDFSLRPFAPVAYYWDARFQITEQVKLKLSEAGIKIPVLQQEVHLISSEGDAVAS